jgi:uncharacterized protein
VKISGEARLKADVAEVYAALQDPAVLVLTLPGCEQLEQTGPDSYRATLTAGVASIKGRFNGEVRLADHEAPHAFTMHASGAGAPGTVNAVARVTLADGDGGGTLLRYDADATIGGVIGGVGQRMITGVARKTAAEFFGAVDVVLAGGPVPAVAAPAGPAATPTGATPTAAGPAAAAPAIWTAPPAPVDPTRQRARDLLVGAIFGAVVALLGVLVGAIVAGWS